MSFQHQGELTAGMWHNKRDVYFLSSMIHEVEEISMQAKDGGTETVNKPEILTLQ